MASKLTITKASNGDYYFSLKAGNGEKVLASQGYNSKDSCKNGIASVKANAPDDSKYEKKESSNGKFYFNLKAANSQVIGTSEMYESASGRDKGIEAVKRAAAEAEIVDES